ncbi:MAG: T9SS type A sorting domain-containing protein [Brumimicrobium sp.]|nr:T9SS type A sorting domain-containing protein [Brumimicrobium sp.]
MRKCTFCLITLFGAAFAFGQTISRQSINAYGGSSQSGKVLIEQSVGQPHQTKTEPDAEVEIRPGFIQSRTFHVEILSENSIEGKVYPNPAREFFKVETMESLDVAEISITKTTGELIKVIKSENFREQSFDCSEWATGTYFLILRDNKGRTFKSKLIISK